MCTVCDKVKAAMLHITFDSGKRWVWRRVAVFGLSVDSHGLHLLLRLPGTSGSVYSGILVELAALVFLFGPFGLLSLPIHLPFSLKTASAATLEASATFARDLKTPLYVATLFELFSPMGLRELRPTLFCPSAGSQF